MGQATSAEPLTIETVRGPTAPDPLLLYSLSFYSELLRTLASLTTSPDIVEVGSEAGGTSPLLAAAAQSRGGQLFVIEPYPSPVLRDLASRRSNVRIIEELSPSALKSVPSAGLFVLDGDHNYGVVNAELREIFDRADSTDSLAVLHDVGWPCGRRDTYYAPDGLPDGSVHPHSFERGATPEQGELGAPNTGFRSEGQYALALREGGPRNGVLTAIEDFLDERPDLRLLTTSLVFGLGVLGSSASSTWDVAAEAFSPYTDNPTLAAMEANRITLYLEVLRLGAELRETQARTLRARAGRVKEQLSSASGRLRDRSA
jgi:PAS domain-containing protein